MKSLLVDVLREAREEKPETEAPANRADCARVDELRTAETDAAAGLGLMATGQFRADEVPVDDESDLADLPPGPLVNIEDVPLQVDCVSTADTAMLHRLGVKRRTSPPMILRIGQLTPVVCLLAVVGVASGYLLINKVTTSSLAGALDDTAEIVQANESSEPWHDAGSQSRFVELSQHPDSSSAASRESAAGPGHAAATQGAALSAAIASSAGAPDLHTAEPGRPAVDDQVFELVANGYAAYQRRDYKAAEQFYDQALVVEPNHRDALLGAAAVYRRTQRDSLALAAYRKVLQVEPGNTVAASAILAARSAEAGSDNESDLKLLIQQFPEADHLHFALGTLYVGKSRWAEARQSFHSAFQLAPANANYSYNLAVSLERLGELGLAARYYEEALMHADSSPNVDRATIESHLGQLAIIARDDR